MEKILTQILETVRLLAAEIVTNIKALHPRQPTHKARCVQNWAKYTTAGQQPLNMTCANVQLDPNCQRHRIYAGVIAVNGNGNFWYSGEVVLKRSGVEVYRAPISDIGASQQDIFQIQFNIGGPTHRNKMPAGQEVQPGLVNGLMVRLPEMAVLNESWTQARPWEVRCEADEAFIRVHRMNVDDGANARALPYLLIHSET